MPLTATGNLSRSAVAEMRRLVEWPDYDQDGGLQFTNACYSATVSIIPLTSSMVFIDVEATPARTYDEVAATKTMLDRTERCFDMKPKRLAADTAYGTGRFLGWLVKPDQ